MNDGLENDLSLAIAHLAELRPPLILVDCSFERLGACILTAFIPPPTTDIAKREAESEVELTHCFTESRRQGLKPTGLMRFLIPGIVIERCGIRDVVRSCITGLQAAVEGRLLASDEVCGVPVHYHGILEKSSVTDNDEEDEDDENA